MGPATRVVHQSAIPGPGRALASTGGPGPWVCGDMKTNFNIKVQRAGEPRAPEGRSDGRPGGRALRAAGPIAGLWLSVSGLLNASAQAAPTLAEVGAVPSRSAELVWRDGGQPRRLARLGPGPVGRTAAKVHAPDGRSWRAEIDGHAVITVDPDLSAAELAARLAPLGAVPVRALSPRLGLWRVARRPEAGFGDRDGADLAARLTAHLTVHLTSTPAHPQAAGTPSAAAPSAAWLREAVPDLWLPHTRHAIDIPPDDPRYGGQWFLARVQMEAAWALSTGALSAEAAAAGHPPVSILVIDTGCATDHPDLAAHFDASYDAVDDDDDPRPEVGFPGDNHGTAVAGVAAAVTDNGEGVAGACPECRLRCVRLLPEDGGPVPLSADIAAFEFALEADVAVVNNSWGFSEPLPVPASLARAITRVATEGRGGRGALVVFAAGNDARPIGDDELQAVAGVVGAGATNNFDELTQFSNSGRAVDVVAPTGTLTTDLVGPDGEDPGDYTRLFGGTSSAAPLVAGVLGLLVAAAPDADADTLTAALVGTAQQSLFARPGPDGHDVEYGYGVIRPAVALRRVLGLPEDGGPADAGVPDAGSTDPAPDAGPTPTDLGVALDGGGADASATVSATDPGGCVQAPLRAGPPALLPALAGILIGLFGLLARARRRSRPEA